MVDFSDLESLRAHLNDIYFLKLVLEPCGRTAAKTTVSPQPSNGRISPLSQGKIKNGSFYRIAFVAATQIFVGAPSARWGGTGGRVHRQGG